MNSRLLHGIGRLKERTASKLLQESPVVESNQGPRFPEELELTRRLVDEREAWVRTRTLVYQQRSPLGDRPGQWSCAV